MKRKEFVERMDLIFKDMENRHWFRFTCDSVGMMFSFGKPVGDYREYISLHLIGGHICYGDYQDAPFVRMLLLQSFKEEVLSTKRYLEY